MNECPSPTPLADAVLVWALLVPFGLLLWMVVGTAIVVAVRVLLEQWELLTDRWRDLTYRPPNDKP